jgi:hypothetical protein
MRLIVLLSLLALTACTIREEKPLHPATRRRARSRLARQTPIFRQARMLIPPAAVTLLEGRASTSTATVPLVYSATDILRLIAARRPDRQPALGLRMPRHARAMNRWCASWRWRRNAVDLFDDVETTRRWSAATTAGAADSMTLPP